MDSLSNSSVSQAIILAGGFGTRLKPVITDRPKALAEISGKPFIEFQLEWLMLQGITKVTLAIHYMGDQLQNFVEKWASRKLVIDTIYEDVPLGTGGAVTNVIQKKNIIGKVLVINGDTIFNFSLKPALNYMQNRKEPIMLIASKIKDASRFGTITVEKGYVKSFQQAIGKHTSGVVNGGAYIIDSTLFFEKNIEPFSLEYDIFPELAMNKQLLAYILGNTESFFDIGTPDSYKKICGK
jgi:D-glycero-alpha-D-manno-heptose 1-phosphate guanylyltransferase